MPIYGSSAPGFAYDRHATIAAINAMASIPNPVPPDERSLRNDAGELVGGLFYHNYPGGAGLMAGAVFGRIAGRSAAEAARG